MSRSLTPRCFRARSDGSRRDASRCGLVLEPGKQRFAPLTAGHDHYICDGCVGSVHASRWRTRDSRSTILLPSRCDVEAESRIGRQN
jgi:hypothetical protein